MLPRCTMPTAADGGWLAALASPGRALHPEITAKAKTDEAKTDEATARPDNDPRRRDAEVCTVDLLTHWSRTRSTADRGGGRSGGLPDGSCPTLVALPTFGQELSRFQARWNGLTFAIRHRVPPMANPFE